MEETSVLQAVEDDVLSQGNNTMVCQTLPPEPLARMVTIGRARAVVFTPEEKEILMKHFEEYGMTSTHRRNTELMRRCAEEIGTTIERVKNWIGSEAVKRKRKAGILPRPRIEITGSESPPKIITGPPIKKFKRVNGYNLFFSDCVRNNREISTEFRERNAVVAQKWAALEENCRKEWALKAEAVCSAAIQDMHPPQPASMGPEIHRSISQLLDSDLNSEMSILDRTLATIQDKFDVLEQLGFEAYSVVISTCELQTHLMATSKGKSFHKMRQQTGKPLENPFIGYVFSDQTVVEQLPASPLEGLAVSATSTSSGGNVMMKRDTNGMFPSLSSVHTMQKSVMNAFSLKYKVATGRSEVPYHNLQALGVQIYGMPPHITFHSPLLYNQQELQQILANLEKIVFLKVGSPILPENSPLSELEISAESVAHLVDSGHGGISIGVDEGSNMEHSL